MEPIALEKDLEEHKKRSKEIAEKLIIDAQIENSHDLFLFCSGLVELPTTLFSLVNLKILDIRGNSLRLLPVEIKYLFNLEELLLDNNKLREIPVECSTLQHLKILSLSYNDLVSIPAELANLRNLIRLDLSYNNLSTIPESLAQFKELSLVLIGNPIIFLPSSFQYLLGSQYQYMPFPQEVLPLNRLFIGDFQASKNFPALKHHGITHILIVANELHPHYPQHFQYLQIKAYDDEREDLLSYLKDPKIHQFIDIGRDAGGVLVHW
jgi:hypothetical protein